jgi:hypothetical protein
LNEANEPAWRAKAPGVGELLPREFTMKRIVTLILFLVFSLAITASAGAVTVLFDPFDDNGNG